MALATHPGVITRQDSDAGIRAKVFAIPLTEGQVITDSDGIHIGEAVAQSDGSGVLQGGGLKTRIKAGVLWDILVVPNDPAIPKYRLLESVNLNTSGVDLKDLASTVPTAVDEQLRDDILDSVTTVQGYATAAATSAAQALAGVGYPSALRNPLTGMFHVDGFASSSVNFDADCQASIAAAKNVATALYALTGQQQRVFFPPRDLPYLSSATSVPSGVTFYGQGGSILRRTGSPTAVFINFSGSPTNCGIEGLKLDSAGLSTSSTVRISTGASKVRMYNFEITDSGPAIAPIDVQAGTSDIEIDRPTAYNTPIGVGDLAIGVGTVTFTDTGDVVTTPAAHGLNPYDPVKFGSITSTTGVTAGPTYYVKPLSTTTFTLVASMADVPIGVGTVTFTDAGDLVTTPAPHGLVADDPVRFGGIATTTGIAAATTYYVRSAGLTSTTFTVAATVGGPAVALTLDGTGSGLVKMALAPVKLTTNGTGTGLVKVSGGGTVTFTASNDRVTTPAAHGLAMGDCIQFGSVVTTTGVVPGEFYFVRQVVSPTEFTVSFGCALVAPTFTTTASNDRITTVSSHNLNLNDPVVFETVVGTPGITAGTTYFVKSVVTPTAVTLAATVGGATIDLTTNSTGTNANRPDVLAIDLVGDGTGAGLAKANGLPNIVKFAANVARPKVTNGVFSGWRERVVYALSSGVALATTDAVVEKNQITRMIPGGQSRQPITFQGVDTALHFNPKIIRNWVYGANESYNDNILRGTADLISVHRSLSGEINGNTCWYGGDVGITYAQQSIGAKIIGNDCQFNDTVGICVGSNTTNYVNEFTVTGNTCKNNGQGRTVARPYRSGVHFNQAGRGTVGSNTVGDDQGAPLIAGGLVTFTDTGDLVTFTGGNHSLAVNDPISFASIATTTGVSANTLYYVQSVPSATTVTLSATRGGGLLALSTNGSGTGAAKPWIILDGAVTFTDTGDLVTFTAGAHGLTVGAAIKFATIATTTGITAGTVYYVKTTPATTTMTLTTTPGGVSTLALTTNGTGSGATRPGTQNYGLSFVTSDSIDLGVNFFTGFTGGSLDISNISGTNIRKPSMVAA